MKHLKSDVDFDITQEKAAFALSSTPDPFPIPIKTKVSGNTRTIKQVIVTKYYETHN